MDPDEGTVSVSAQGDGDDPESDEETVTDPEVEGRLEEEEEEEEEEERGDGGDPESGEGSVADTEVEAESREDSPPPESDEETVTDTEVEGRLEEEEEEEEGEEGEETGSQARRIAVMANQRTAAPRGSDAAAAASDADIGNTRFDVEVSFRGTSSPVVPAVLGEEVRLDPKEKPRTGKICRGVLWDAPALCHLEVCYICIVMELEQYLKTATVFARAVAMDLISRCLGLHADRFIPCFSCASRSLY